MKKNMIALAVAAAVAAPAAMADTTIYGKLNMNWVMDDVADTETVNSTASRIGFKGSKDIDNGLKVVYKMEYGIDLDSKTNVFSQRNEYLGLAGGFGTVLMGTHDTPLKMSQPSDLFNDGAADLGKDSMTNGIAVGEDRLGNVMAYVSPSFSGVKVVAATVGATEWSNATSIAVTYGSTKDGIYAAAAQTSVDNAETITRLSAQYKANGLTANIMHSDAEDATAGTNGTVTTIQAAYKMGKFMPKVKYSMTDNDDTGADETGTSIGLNYSMGNKTTAYIYTVDGADNSDKTIFGMVTKF